jgi:hypothetical protein
MFDSSFNCCILRGLNNLWLFSLILLLDFTHFWKIEKKLYTIYIKFIIKVKFIKILMAAIEIFKFFLNNISFIVKLLMY